MIAGADIWSWLALPERDLVAVPDWFEKAYPGRSSNDPQIVGVLPFSLNASSDIRFSAGPVSTDDEALQASEQAIGEGDIEGYNSLNEIRDQHLNMLEVIPNATAEDLEALARGDWDNTPTYFSFGNTWKDIATGRLDFLLANKTGIISRLNVRDRAFSDDTGSLHWGAMGAFHKRGLLRYLNTYNVSGFRTLGLYFPVPDKDLMELPNNENIVLYITGSEYRKNIFSEFVRYDPEPWGILYLTENGRDPAGNFNAPYDFTIFDNGRGLTIGEPKVGVTQVDPMIRTAVRLK